jgi:hypothetical protein
MMADNQNYNDRNFMSHLAEGYMMTRLSFVVIVLLISGSILTIKAKPTIGYMVSIDRPAIRDGLLVPLSFSGAGLGLGIDSRLQGEFWAGGASFNMVMGYVWNRYDHGGVIWPIDFKIYAARQIYSIAEKGCFEIRIPVTLSQRDYYIFSWDDAHLYWLTAHWSGIGLGYHVPISTMWKLSAFVQTPLFSFVARPPDYRYNKQDALKRISFYFSKTQEGLTFTLPDQFRGIDADLTIGRSLKRTYLSISLFYSCFAYYHGDDVISSSLGIRLTQRWGG